MEAISHLTGDITHDFNNILTRIMDYFVMAQKWAERLQGSKLERYLKCAQHSGERARDLIQQMLTFSRGQRGEPRSIGLDAVITESLALLAVHGGDSHQARGAIVCRIPRSAARGAGADEPVYQCV
jgi:signal transduction histidine kinase